MLFLGVATVLVAPAKGDVLTSSHHDQERDIHAPASIVVD
jgi:hypothetical protein